MGEWVAPKRLSERIVLALDLDNTVYDFVAFYAKAFRAMVHVVSKQIRVDRAEVESQFRNVFQKAGTLDFRDLVQNLPLTQALPEDGRKRLVNNVRRAYDLSKRKQLRSYTNMPATLAAIEAAGVAVIVVTNAPLYHAYTRLRDVGVLPYVYGLVAWEGTNAIGDGGTTDEHILQTHTELLGRARHKLQFLATFQRGESKPSSHPFMLIRERFGDALYYAVGDSLSKDLLPAARVGMKTIWARYGTRTQDARDLDTILAMTPWSTEEISFHLDRAFSPDYVIDDPRDLLGILPHYDQLSFFEN